MGSEKVKEIKKALECCMNPKLTCCNDCPYNNNGRLSCIESEMLKDALNLINEQENEIKRLRQEVRDTDKMARNSIEQYKNDYDKAFERLKAQQREIDRLKIQLEQANAGIVNCSGCKFVELNAVKDFAEKLKNKLFEFFQDNEELDGKISVGLLYVDVIGVEAKDGTIISLGLIDETLKEYENDTI